MAVLAWGKPKIEHGPSTAGAAATVWTAFDTPKEDSTELVTTPGDKIEAKEEGGDVVDARYKASSYELSFELFVKKGGTRPFTDINGVIAGDHSVRLTPEDEEAEGFVMDCCTVSVADSFKTADGKMLKYTFTGKKPASGNICKPYVADDGE